MRRPVVDCLEVFSRCSRSRLNIGLVNRARGLSNRYPSLGGPHVRASCPLERKMVTENSTKQRELPRRRSALQGPFLERWRIRAHDPGRLGSRLGARGPGPVTPRDSATGNSKSSHGGVKTPSSPRTPPPALSYDNARNSGETHPVIKAQKSSVIFSGPGSGGGGGIGGRLCYTAPQFSTIHSLKSLIIAASEGKQYLPPTPRPADRVRRRCSIKDFSPAVAVSFATVCTFDYSGSLDRTKPAGVRYSVQQCLSPRYSLTESDEHK